MNLILLAAGYSRRFPGRKLLAEINGKPLYLITLEKLCTLCDRHPDWLIVVVTSYDEIEAYCKTQQISCVKNVGAENTGIASSIQKAVHFLETIQKDAGRQTADVFFTADQPLLDCHVVEQFLLAYEAQEQKAGTLVCEDIWRNPNIFDASYRTELLSLTGDTGGKQILKNHREDVFCFQTADAFQFSDIDTAKDYFSLTGKNNTGSPFID